MNVIPNKIVKSPNMTIKGFSREGNKIRLETTDGEILTSEIGNNYKLFAWSVDSLTNTYGYTEYENVEVGDIVLMGEVSSGKLEDASDLTTVLTVTSIAADGTIYAQATGSASSIHLSRYAEYDYEEEITDIKNVVDVAENGLLISEKGTVFKALNINV